jgi:hypothetical protein
MQSAMLVARKDGWYVPAEQLVGTEVVPMQYAPVGHGPNSALPSIEVVMLGRGKIAPTAQK